MFQAKRNWRLSTVVILPLVLLLAACSNVQEVPVLIPLAQPEIQEPLNYTFEDTIDCGEFEIAESGEAWVNITNFYNQDGALTRVHIRARFTGTLTNKTTGYTVSDGPDAYHFFYNYEDGALDTIRITGLYYIFRDLDGKKVALDAGTITLIDGEFSYKGPHDITATGGLCAFMDK